MKIVHYCGNMPNSMIEYSLNVFRNYFRERGLDFVSVRRGFWFEDRMYFKTKGNHTIKVYEKKIGDRKGLYCEIDNWRFSTTWNNTWNKHS